MSWIHSQSAAVILLSSLFAFFGPSRPVWSAEAKGGKALYDKLCVSCHGAEGKGNPAMVKAMGEKGLNIVGKETAQKKDEELVKVITAP